ncbi:ATPase [Alkalilimnicola ehrlichii]|uniref:ATPase n=1 Tax=Alkalilimnicola ehrlichii TaxID=351052 RepID=A0A3E0WR84_9GAMM|nr:SRPBCC family protein [Alkalilimnicola ehrlichii]RFA27174.1 ATPase [Alkalilimnicola ehrlichii]RFA35348.1 ATPase [Alkalilimnicola ehrlichii]
MDKPQFVYVTYIDTTPAQLWEALTGGEFTSRYWGGRRIRSDWQPGAAVELIKADGSVDWKGEVLTVEPHKKLSYTFDPLNDEELPDYEGERVDLEKREPPSRVTFEIYEHMGKVRLTLIHDEFPQASRILPGITHGWPAILSSLKSLLERGEPLFPDWR